VSPTRRLIADAAATPGHPLGRRVAPLFEKPTARAGIRLDLRQVDRATAELATVLGARYNLRAADSIHLATAVTMGARRFITNNSKDFGAYIEEIDVTFPGDLPG
jgi:predicted nucleic acid-binding protein